MINRINELASVIESKWDPQNAQDDAASFSSIAFSELKSFDLSLSLGELEESLTAWLLKSEIPSQLNVYNGFGEPPVTLYNNGKFVIDLYFWRSIDTSVHSHSFSGAFKVVFGRSVHEEYQIRPVSIYSNDIMKTDYSLLRSKLIKSGSCHEIISGNKFSHRLVHLDDPTITLCVRTIQDQAISQWHHFSNGLSVEKKELSQSVLKSLYYFQYLCSRDTTLASTFCSGLIEKWSSSELLNLYERLSLDPMGLEEGISEVFIQSLLKRIKDTEWFKLYEEFYRDMESRFVEFEEDNACNRFLQHALVFGYERGRAQELLAEIKGEELGPREIELLSELV